ncbi:Acetyltransferase GNAT family [Aspergillus sclerotialis]|uniref:Acetyltransferase GNAT family n=1 Tax=Aspergillus sclerotialis TaxID=2070753 RepID=A0A3A2ZCH1_9EURO|nr:Acetyltransferase GNAT family [Aspergillus sclerotialis]
MAFSSDPLIQWLRPNAIPWAQPNDSVWKWQYRRIQSVMAHGKVFQSASVEEMAQEFPQKHKPEVSGDVNSAHEKALQISVPDSSINIDCQEDAGAVVFIFPPKGQLSWSLGRLWLAYKVWLLELLSPADDEGSKKQRVEKLLAANKTGLQSLQTQYSKDNVWYLEVVAVHPSLQSRGLGREVMKWILELVGNQPLYLECTRLENLCFYESFGFRVVNEVTLADDEGPGEKENQTLRYWVMVRSEQTS